MIEHSGFDICGLYRRFKKGDEKAFESIYQGLSPGIFNYSVRLLGDRHLAEDVLVETFTKFANADLDTHGNLKAWLYRVATNACYTLLRKRRCELKCFEEQMRSALGNPGPDFTKELRVQRLLTKLPEYQRIVVILKFYERMTYREIADILCCPLGTVKSRMHKSLHKLRNLMEDSS